MTAPGLRADFLAAMGAIRQRELDTLRGLGITGQNLIASGLIGRAPIRKTGRLFELDEDGKQHFVTPVYDGPAHRDEGPVTAWPALMIDWCAWLPDRPHRWWLRTGYGWCLGQDHVELSGWFDDVELRLHATPLAWIKAGGLGACVLDWESASFRLDGIGKIIAEDSRHAREIRRRLMPPAPAMPRIIYPKRRAVA